MGTRRIHTNSSAGNSKYRTEMPASMKLISVAEYVTDMGFYDSIHEDLDNNKAKADVQNAVKSFKSKNKPH